MSSIDRLPQDFLGQDCQNQSIFPQDPVSFVLLAYALESEHYILNLYLGWTFKAICGVIQAALTYP